MIDYENIADSVHLPETGGPTESEAPEVEIPVENLSAATREYLPVSHPKYQGLATEKGYSQACNRIQVMKYTHEAMIDVILAQPGIKQIELAKIFERSVPWISRIIGSDSFQAALAKRRDDITDPFLVATIEERMRGLAFQSLDIIAERLELTKNVDLALKGLDISSKALGFGSRGGGGSQQNNQFIIQLPPKSADSGSWAAQHSPLKSVGSG